MGLFNNCKGLACGIADLFATTIFHPIGHSRPEYKSVNPIYSTFKGGYGGWRSDWSDWDYFCLWGHLRFCYDKRELKDDWIHISLHGYTNGYTYTPVKTLLWNFDWHFAFNKKWPFIKIGFNNIENLYKIEN